MPASDVPLPAGAGIVGATGMIDPAALDPAALDPAALDLVALARAIADGDLTAEAATTAALDRADRYRALNAVVELDRDAALEAARRCDRERARVALRGPLHGVPLAHKDMFDRAGRISGCGAAIRAEVPPAATATVLARLDRAGAVELGRLHMAEFALGPTGHNAQLGRCGNPWHPGAISGGSSSGCGAAVAAGIVPASLGSDTGGSVRLPAAFCGVVGLKTTQHRLPMDGVMPLSASLDTIGPIARSSRDIALMMAVLTGGEPGFDRIDTADPALAGLTIGVPTNYFTDRLDPPVAAALAEARAVLAACGARLVEVAVPDQDEVAALAAAIWLPEAAAVHRARRLARPDDYGAQVRNRLMAGFGVTAVDYLDARQRRDRHVAAMLGGPLALCDALLTPVCRTVTPLADAVDATGGAEMERVIADISALTRTVSCLGLPALTTPMGHDPRGLPIGLQLIGRPRAEALLLRIGHDYERATAWLARRPPLSAVPVPETYPATRQSTKEPRSWISASSFPSATMAG